MLNPQTRTGRTPMCHSEPAVTNHHVRNKSSTLQIQNWTFFCFLPIQGLRVRVRLIKSNKTSRAMEIEYVFIMYLFIAFSFL